MGHFPFHETVEPQHLVATYEPLGQSEPSMSDYPATLVIPDKHGAVAATVPGAGAPTVSQALPRGTFSMKPAPDGPLTYVGDGKYVTSQREMLELGGELNDEEAGGNFGFWTSEKGKALVAEWVERQQRRALLRRCKPMIERLRQQFGTKVLNEMSRVMYNFRACRDHAESDDEPWLAVDYNGASRLRAVAADIEVWNALQ